MGGRSCRGVSHKGMCFLPFAFPAAKLQQKLHICKFSSEKKSTEAPFSKQRSVNALKAH